MSTTDPGGPRGLPVALTAATAALSAMVAAGTAAAFGAQYDDVAPEVGVVFRHAGGGADAYFYEVTGSGACFGDFDGDGYEDLFLANERYHDFEDNVRWFPTNRLFRNDGDGSFTDVSFGSNVDRNGWYHGCAVGDLDQDGDLDLVLSAYGWSVYFRNSGDMTFANATAQAGLQIAGKCGDLFPCWGTGVSLADTNLDGCLDVYFVNYVEYTDLVDRGNSPTLYPGQRNLYFESLCDGTFLDRTDAANLDDDPGQEHSKSFQPVWTDYDRNGLPDVYVASDTTPNSLFRNNGDGSFTDVAPSLDVDDPRASMGVEVDDVDGDGDPELYMTHFEGEHNGFYFLDGEKYKDRGGEGDLGKDLWFVGWGATFADLDLDGRKEIFIVNGDVTHKGSQRRLAWTPDSNGGWRDVSFELGDGVLVGTVARGLSKCDHDFDGDVDFVVVNNDNQSANFLRASGVSGRWLEIQLRDPGGNGRAIGAEVKVALPGGVTQVSAVQAGSSYLGQHCHNLHFGLGGHDEATVEVRWPGGDVQSVGAVPHGRVARVTRGVEGYVDDVLAPRTTAIVTGPLRAGWYSGVPRVDFVAEDLGLPVPHGVSRIEYRVGGDAWKTFTEPFTLGEGRHVLRYRAIDVAGNEEPVRTLIVRVDLTPPGTASAVEAAQGDEGWLVTEARVTLSASDELSGVDRTLWRDGDGSERTYEGPFTLGEGDHALAYASEDVAGNREADRSRRVKVDLTPPVTELSLEGDWIYDQRVIFLNGDSRIVLTGADATSGVRVTEYRLGGGAWQTYAGQITPEGRDGPFMMEIRSKDRAGLEERPARWDFWLDNHAPPRLDVTSPRSNAVHAGVLHHGFGDLGPVERVLERQTGEPEATLLTGRVPVNAIAGRDVSGIAHVRVHVDGILRHETSERTLQWTWDTGAEAPGMHVLELSAADGHGNERRVRMPVRIVPLPTPAPGGAASAQGSSPG